MEAILCARCGAPLPSHAAHGVVTCSFCGTSAAPAPKVIEKVVDRVVVVQGPSAAGATNVPPCPRCAEPTRRVEHGAHVAYVCTACGGALLGPAELAHLRAVRDEDFVRDVRRAVGVIAPYARRHAALSCPACRGPLRKEQVGESVLLMHACATHGTFFEHGAVEAFTDMWAERRAGDISDEDLEALGIKR